MKKDERLYLDIVLESIEAIESHVGGVTFDVFDRSLKDQDAVNMRLQVIGENVGKLSEGLLEKWRESVPWHKVVGMRHLISHDYDELDMEEVWNVVVKDLPILKKVVREMLESLGG